MTREFTEEENRAWRAQQPQKTLTSRTNTVPGKSKQRSLRADLIEAGGWYGAAAVLLAYALVSFNAISPHGWIYQLLNFTGAVGVLIISYMKHARQPALLNFVWAVIALVALIQLAI
jgi:hypothetical protein